MNTPETLTPIAEYSPTAAAIADLKGRYGGIVLDVSNGKGMTQAKEARAELRGYRVALEAKRVEIKAPALERCRLIDAEAKRITAEIVALEEPIDATIKAEETRKANEKAAKEAAEAERIRVQTEWFDQVKAIPLGAMGRDAAGIRGLLAQAEAIDVGAAPIGPDMVAAAKFTRQLTINTLKAALDARLVDDERQAQIARDLAELAERRAAEEAERAERERAAAEAAAAERAAREAAEAAERAEREAAERAQREQEAAEREAERQRIAAERAELERAQAARAAEIAEQDRQRREQQAREDAEREAARKADEAEREKRRQELAAQEAELARQKVAKRLASTPLVDAARDALELLNESGHADHLVTQTLASAIARESKAIAA
jgi:colicin import membrane protein